MAVTIVNTETKVDMFLDHLSGESLTYIGEVNGVSRQTARRCIQEVNEFIRRVRAGEVTTVLDRSGEVCQIIQVDSPVEDSVPFLIRRSSGAETYMSLKTAMDSPEVDPAPQTEYVLGARVLLKPGSRFTKGDLYHAKTNPVGVEGEITVVNKPKWLPLVVKWDNGRINSYAEEDLLLVEVELEEEDTAEYFVVAPQDSITIIRMVDGEVESRNINKHTTGFAGIRAMIAASQDKATLSAAYVSMDIKDVVSSYSIGRVKIDIATESVLFVRADGSERKIPEDIAIDIIGTVQEYGRESGDRLAKFLDKLMDNTSFKAIEGLYRFMKHNCISINEDGSIEAWKGVRDDLYSKRGGSIQSSDTITVDGSGHVYNGDFGTEIRVDRSEVDDDPDATCSHGLHVGNREYASMWASTLICVKVQPQDVVAVPKDYNGAKMRTCAYTPMFEV